MFCLPDKDPVSSRIQTPLHRPRLLPLGDPVRESYKDSAEHVHLFDTTEYSKDPLNNTSNENVFGKLKEWYAGLRPNIYTIQEACDRVARNTKNFKDVKRNVVKKHTRQKQYKDFVARRHSPMNGYTKVWTPPFLQTAPEHSITVPFYSKPLIAENRVYILLSGLKDVIPVGQASEGHLCRRDYKRDSSP